MADPVSTAVQGVDSSTLAGSAAPAIHDLSPWAMFMQAELLGSRQLAEDERAAVAALPELLCDGAQRHQMP